MNVTQTSAVVVLCLLPSACGGANKDAHPDEVFPSPVYACGDIFTESRTTLVPGDGGPGSELQFHVQGGTSSVDDWVKAGFDVLADRAQRRRAALVCHCRARTHRNAASARGTESDALVWFGSIFSVGGGVTEGIAASGVNTPLQKALNETGIGVLALGSLAFGLNAALNLPSRATKHTAAAETQEYAAAILANDSAGGAAWSNAWAGCVQAEGAESEGILTNPQLAFANGGDAGSAPGNAPSGTDDGGPLPSLGDLTPDAGH